MNEERGELGQAKDAVARTPSGSGVTNALGNRGGESHDDR